MTETLKDLLDNDKKLDAQSKQHAQVAAAGLLVSLAHGDQNFSGAEISRIATVLFKEFGLSEAESGELFELVEFMLKSSDATDKFVIRVNESFDTAGRQRLLSVVWKVIAADGKADKHEAKLAASLRQKLNLTLEEAVHAQVMAQQPEDFVAPKLDDEYGG